MLPMRQGFSVASWVDWDDPGGRDLDNEAAEAPMRC